MALEGYLPEQTPAAWGMMGCVVAGLIVAGYGLQRKPSKAGLMVAWALALAAPIAMHETWRGGPNGFRMLAVFFPLFFGMKAVVGTHSALVHGQNLTFMRWAIFALTWPGMRPRLFMTRRPQPIREAKGYLWFGFTRMMAGLGVLGLAYLASRGDSEAINIWLASGLLLVSISLLMHFGFFTMMAGVLQLAGFDARPLFRYPLRSVSLEDFWSRRWNLAYSEMTSLVIFRPVAKRQGRGMAAASSFLVSGLFHDMAISLPAGGGYGLPTLYFVIQGAVSYLEARVPMPRGVKRMVTYATVLLPAPLLFHPWFIRTVVRPMLG